VRRRAESFGTVTCVFGDRSRETSDFASHRARVRCVQRLWVVSALGAIGTAAALTGAGCGTLRLADHGNPEQIRWLQDQLTRPAPGAAEPPTSRAPFEMLAEVQVSPSTNRGLQHNPAERSSLPDLVLYVTVQGERVTVGQSANATTLSGRHPLSLQRGDSVMLRLVDRTNSYFRVRYDSASYDDRASEDVREFPLAQFSFQFEGTGRYFFQHGYGTFVLDMRTLR
jgi:hypothetical protein